MEFLKKLRAFDIVIILVLIAAAMIGLLTFLGKRATSSAQIEASVPVEIEAFFRGVTVTSANSPFKEGEETFITIRNVPYTKLKIKKIAYERKKAIVPTSNSKQPFVVVDDVTSPFQYDYLVTVLDDAKITKDGAVVGGNKIKIGLPVIFEGPDYKFSGVVTNITIVSEPSKVPTGDTPKQVQENKDAR